jgi:hypothetical protein
MNGWDLFTWINSALLFAAAVVIFALFLKDAGGILAGQGRDGDREQDDAQSDVDPDRT